MLGLISAGLIGVVGYKLYSQKKSNNYTVAKLIESAINRGERNFEISGYFDKGEVARIMAEDGYNLFDYVNFGRANEKKIPEKIMSLEEFRKRYKEKLRKLEEMCKVINNLEDFDIAQEIYKIYIKYPAIFDINKTIEGFDQTLKDIKRALETE